MDASIVTMTAVCISVAGADNPILMSGAFARYSRLALTTRPAPNGRRGSHRLNNSTVASPHIAGLPEGLDRRRRFRCHAECGGVTIQVTLRMRTNVTRRGGGNGVIRTAVESFRPCLGNVGHCPGTWLYHCECRLKCCIAVITWHRITVYSQPVQIPSSRRLSVYRSLASIENIRSGITPSNIFCRWGNGTETPYCTLTIAGPCL